MISDLGGSLAVYGYREDTKGEQMKRAERLKKMLTQIAPRNAIEAVSRPGVEERGGFERLGPGNTVEAE